MVRKKKIEEKRIHESTDSEKSKKPRKETEEDNEESDHSPAQLMGIGK